jgi:hypothetical protein
MKGQNHFKKGGITTPWLLILSRHDSVSLLNSKDRTYGGQ